MKVGENPQRGDSHGGIATARIFVVVYLPHLNGFFSDMEKILTLSLDSLERTVDPELGRVTLISNACCPEIEALLQARRSKLFDQIIINNNNLGKVDGLLSSARGALEDVVVLSDCDVLFIDGWLEEVLHVFSIFPEAASVCPNASPKRFAYESSTTLLGSALSRELAITQRMPVDDFYRFTEGKVAVGDQMRFVNGQVSVTREGYSAGISGGHQCIAYRNEMIRKLPNEPCHQLLDPHSDKRYLDRPPDQLGYWRLSTSRVMAFHMGNKPSEWMFRSDRSDAPRFTPNLPLRPLRRPLVGWLPYIVRRKLAHLVYMLVDRRIEQQSHSNTVALADKGLST